MVQFKVGDVVRLQASVNMMFCGTSNLYNILDINISAPGTYIPNTGTSCAGFDLSGIQLEFQWVNSRASTETHYCYDTVKLATLENVTTDSQGKVSIDYTITNTDLTYFNSNSTTFDLRVCIKNKVQSEVVNLGKVRNEITSHFEDYITIVPALPPTATHYLDVYVKPHSWYTPGGAASDITTKLADISGAILNGMTEAGLTTWTYINTEIVTETDRVIIRVYLNEIAPSPPFSTYPMLLSTYPTLSSSFPEIRVLVLGPWTIIAIAIGVVIIGIGIIAGYSLYKAAQTLLSETYTKTQVGEYTNNILTKNTESCGINFPNDPVGYANCVKSAIQAVTTAGGDFFNDPTITQSGQTSSAKIDTCITQYNAGQLDTAGLTTCTQGAVKDTQGTITNQTKPTGTPFGSLMILGLGLVGLYMVTRPVEKAAAAFPVFLKESKEK